MTDKLKIFIQAAKKSLPYRNLAQTSDEESKSAITELDLKKKSAQKIAIDEILIIRDSILKIRNLEIFLQFLEDLMDYTLENYDLDYLKQSLSLDEEIKKLLLRLKIKIFSIMMPSKEKKSYTEGFRKVY